MPPRITVVDDSPEIRSLFADVLGPASELTLLGASVTLEEIEASRPDLLVIDLRLGTDHLPGWEIVRHLRAHPPLDALPIIVCSGALAHVRDDADVRIGSASTYLLPKPFSLADLESVVRDALATPSAGSSRLPADRRVSDFADDPHAWFDVVGSLLGTEEWGATVEAIQPAAWSPGPGRGWRLVRTSLGIEVRPELVSPFLTFGDQPKVTAIGLGADVRVELTTAAGRWVDRFAAGTFDVAALGHAMLDEHKLPHDNLPRLFPPRRAEGSEAAVATIHIGADQPARERLRA